MARLFRRAPEAIDREPTPDEAAVLAETVEGLMRSLHPRDREILALSLKVALACQLTRLSDCLPLAAERLVVANKFSFWNADVFIWISHSMSNALRLTAIALQNRNRLCHRIWIDHIAEADTHVEDLEHLAVFDLGIALDKIKDWMRVD